MTPGQIIREARLRHGLNQSQLAFRAGTQQPAISRLEKDEVSPSIETMELLLRSMGESFEFGARPVERNYDPLHRKAVAKKTPEERLQLAISWNRTAGSFAAAGREALAKQGAGE